MDQGLMSRGLPPASEAIKSSRILLIGAGGIGCELLKTLVQSGFETIHVVDLDTIDVSNLNRQFLFRKCHIGMSKAQVSCETVKQFTLNANLCLTPHHKNIKSEEFDAQFFKSFNLVLNALDNVSARQHVNRMCLAVSVPLIDAGTTGYLGQTTVILKGKTQCFDCEPKKEDKNLRFPICTIRSTPDKPVHCIVWAKELFKLIFGNPEESDLIDKDAAAHSIVMQAVRPFEREKPLEYSKLVFQAVFGDDIVHKKEMRKSDPTYNPRPLVYPSAPFTVPPTSNQQSRVWTVEECVAMFESTLNQLLSGGLHSFKEFDKDDNVSMAFVCAAANLRCENFGIERKSLFEVKGIAGNIIHAIATTNAIVAGIQVLEAIRLLTHNNDTTLSRFVWVNRNPSSTSMLLMSCKLDQPEPQCVACGKAEMHVYADLTTATFDLVVNQVLKRRLGLTSPLVSFGTTLLYECGEELDKEEVDMYSRNLTCLLQALPGKERVREGSQFHVTDLMQNMSFFLTLHHRQGKVDSVSGETVGDEFELEGTAPEVVVEKTLEEESSGSKKARIQEDEDDDDDEVEML